MGVVRGRARLRLHRPDAARPGGLPSLADRPDDRHVALRLGPADPAAAVHRTGQLPGCSSTSEEFWSALRNTVYYVIGVVPVQTAFALLLALVANRRIRGRTFFRAAFYFPSISSSVVVALMFLWIFQGGGLADWILTLLGGTRRARPGSRIRTASWICWQRPWAGSCRPGPSGPSVALLSIMVLNVWTTTGTMMVIFLAGLQDIPRELQEAAAVDGADGARSVFGRSPCPCCDRSCCSSWRSG